MAFVGPPAIEPPGIPVDSAHPHHEGQCLVAGRKFFVYLLGQLAHRGLHMVQIGLLVGLEPRALVVEANTPEKIIGGL